MVKQSLSNLDVYVITYELKKLLINGTVENIYQSEKQNIIIFKIRAHGQVFDFVVEPGIRANITKYDIPKTPQPPHFVNMLRQFMRGGRILDVYQRDFDRIIVLKIQSEKGRFLLVLEIFSFGNIILVKEEDNKIKLALKYKRMRDRNIIINEPFSFPPSREINIFTLDNQKIQSVFENKEVYKGLLKLNLGPELVNELCMRANVDPKGNWNTLEDTKKKKILEEIKLLKDILEEKRFKFIVYLDEEENPVHIAPIEEITFSKYNKKEDWESYNDAVDFYFIKMTKEKAPTTLLDRKITDKLKKLKTRLMEQEKDYSKKKSIAENYEKVGMLLYQHMNILERIREFTLHSSKEGTSKEVISEKLKEAVNKLGFIEELQLAKKEPVIKVKIKGYEINIDYRRKISEIANEYFERGKKAKRKLITLQKEIEKTKEEIEKMEREREITLSEEKKKIHKKKEKKWFQKYRWFVSSAGILVVGGKDAKTNDILIKKYLDTRDILIHADIHGAPMVIIKPNENQEIDEKTIWEATQFAVSFSRAWKEGVGSADAYWVYPDQVSKTPPSGEYLAKGAVIIRGKRNYIKSIPLELKIGLCKVYDDWEIMCGPPNAIDAHCTNSLLLHPGEVKKGELVKKIKVFFEKQKPDPDIWIDINEIQNVLPPGSGKIITKRSK